MKNNKYAIANIALGLICIVLGIIALLKGDNSSFASLLVIGIINLCLYGLNTRKGKK